MSERYFLDTNIFVYSFDPRYPQKQSVAKQWIKHALSSGFGVVSTQVIQEFCNVALRKFARPMTTVELQAYVDTVFVPLCQHFPSVTFYKYVLSVQAETQYSFYDAMMLSAALELDCVRFLSEDLQAGQKIHGIEIVNPFL